MPAVVELAKKNGVHARYLLALQRLRDARAIPPLLEMLQAYKKTPNADDGKRFTFDAPGGNAGCTPRNRRRPCC